MRRLGRGSQACRGARFAILATFATLWLTPAAAEEASDHPYAALVAVAPALLDEMRGGFEIDGGLKLSFGIERISYINGVLVAAQTVNVPNLVAASQGLVADAVARAGDIGLIQNGSGNSFTIDAHANMIGNVIQNTADNQKIATRTVIDSTVNSLQVLRSLNLQSAVRDGIIGALRR